MVIVLAIVGLIVGLGIGYFIFNLSGKKKHEEEAKRIIEDAKREAESIAKEKAYEAKEKFFKLKSEFDNDIQQRKQEVATGENRIKQKEQSLNDRLAAYDKKEKDLSTIKGTLNLELDNIKKRKDFIYLILSFLNIIQL